jgi:hypothetical protein
MGGLGGEHAMTMPDASKLVRCEGPALRGQRCSDSRHRAECARLVSRFSARCSVDKGKVSVLSRRELDRLMRTCEPRPLVQMNEAAVEVRRDDAPCVLCALRDAVRERTARLAPRVLIVLTHANSASPPDGKGCQSHAQHGARRGPRTSERGMIAKLCTAVPRGHATSGMPPDISGQLRPAPRTLRICARARTHARTHAQARTREVSETTCATNGTLLQQPTPSATIDRTPYTAARGGPRGAP